MPFIITQQVQPAFIMARHAVAAGLDHLAAALSPLVQVMQTPLSVISHLHMPMVMLQQQTIMPFIIMQQLHMPPAIIVQRFCIMLQAILSSQMQVIFMPPVHFSILIVQRGTIIMFGSARLSPCGRPRIPMPGIPITVPLGHHRVHLSFLSLLVHADHRSSF